MEKTAIELLKETRKFLNEECRPLDYHYVNELVNAIDAYLSSPPSERAMKLVDAIRNPNPLITGPNDSIKLYPGSYGTSREYAAREIEAFGQWWISVKNKLPLYGQPVICTRDTGDELIFEALIWDEEEERYMGKTFNNITHWMPLPPAPEAQGEKNGKDIFEVRNEMVSTR